MKKRWVLFKRTLARRGPGASVRALSHARMVEWQTRTFEGRMAQAVRVQVPLRALFSLTWEGFPVSPPGL
jgi:hypothetical protein